MVQSTKVVSRRPLSLWIIRSYDGRARRSCMHMLQLVDCNPLTPLLRFVLDLSYKLFLHCYAAVGKIGTLRHAV